MQYSFILVVGFLSNNVSVQYVTGGVSRHTSHMVNDVELLKRAALLDQWEQRLKEREDALVALSQSTEANGNCSCHHQSLTSSSSASTARHVHSTELKHRSNNAKNTLVMEQEATMAAVAASPSKQHVPPLSAYIRSGKFLRSAVFGGLDGLTTSIVLICSTSGLVKSDHHGGDGEHTGSHISATILFALGMANLIADAFSMGMGDFLSSLAEAEQAEGGGDASSTPNTALLSDPGFIEAARNGLAMFASFILFGVVPLAAYAPWTRHLNDGNKFIVACLLGVSSLFVLGMIKGYLMVQGGKVSSTQQRRAVAWAGFKMMCMGSIASVISFAVSMELHSG